MTDQREDVTVIKIGELAQQMAETIMSEASVEELLKMRETTLSRIEVLRGAMRLLDEELIKRAEDGRG